MFSEIDFVECPRQQGGIGNSERDEYGRKYNRRDKTTTIILLLWDKNNAGK